LVGHSIEKKIKFSECGHWITQSFLPANVGEDSRFCKERGVPDGILVGTELLSVLAVAASWGQK